MHVYSLASTSCDSLEVVKNIIYVYLGCALLDSVNISDIW